jgi:capsular exopolysaccharide synthesis family protein
MSAKRGFPAVLDALKTRWWVVLLCALIAGTAAFASRELREKEYQASSSVLFRSTNLDASVLNGTSYFDRSNDPLRTAATNFELIQSPAVAARVSEQLAGRLTPEAIERLVSFREIGSSDVVEISATDRSATDAALIANTWATEFVAYRRETDRSQVAEAIALIRGELERSDAVVADERIQDLRQTLERLRVVQALQTGGAEVIDTASVPDEPVGPSIILVVAGATLLGALLGLATATLAQRRDQRLKTPDDAAALLDIPLLANVPRIRSGGSSALTDLTGPDAREAFRTLALRLRFFDLDRARQVVAVMSAESGEGKTTVALRLASTYAAMGRRVIVVDCDLRDGDIRLRLPLDGGPGLVEVLSGQATIADAVQRIEFDSESAVAGEELKAALYAIPTGASPPNPIQMLSSNAMRELMSALRESFDHVILDTAPLLRVSDTEALIELVDGIIVVSRLQHSTTDDLRRLSTVIGARSTQVLGVVVNDVGRREAGRAQYGTVKPAGQKERVGS